MRVNASGCPAGGGKGGGPGTSPVCWPEGTHGASPVRCPTAAVPTYLAQTSSGRGGRTGMWCVGSGLFPGFTCSPKCSTSCDSNVELTSCWPSSHVRSRGLALLPRLAARSRARPVSASSGSLPSHELAVAGAALPLASLVGWPASSRARWPSIHADIDGDALVWPSIAMLTDGL